MDALIEFSQLSQIHLFVYRLCHLTLNQTLTLTLRLKLLLITLPLVYMLFIAREMHILHCRKLFIGYIILLFLWNDSC